MKTSCSSWSYHRTFEAGKMDQMSWLQQCARLDLDGVELLAFHFPSREVAYLKKLKKQCVDLRLTIAMVSAGGHLTVGDDATRADEVKGIAQWIDVAAYMGAPLVRFFVGSGEEMDAGGPALYAKVKAAVQEVASLGEKAGIVMAMENHGGVTADQLLSLHRDVNHPYLKFTLDTGNFPPTSTVGPETYKSIERCAPLAGIVHAKFFNVSADGSDKDFDWNRIHQILTDTGYRGFLSIEYEGNDADEPAVMTRIARFLKTLR